MTNVITETQSLPGATFLKKFLWKNANPGAFAFEMKAAWKIINTKSRIYHMLYPRYRYIDLLNNFRQNRLVATIHSPPSHLLIHRKRRPPSGPLIDKRLLRLSALICVGSTQAELLSNSAGREKVFFVPHGIDTDYFSPPRSFDGRSTSICLFVGFALRDFGTLQRVIELVTAQRREVRFVLIVSPSSKKLSNSFGTNPNVERRTDIPESELLELYQSASMMVVPLLDSTANNAILESLACGLPVVTTDVGSIRDYVNSECAVLVPPRDPVRMAEEVLKLLDNRAKLQSMSENARQQALRFSWPKIVKQLQSIYEAIG